MGGNLPYHYTQQDTKRADGFRHLLGNLHAGGTHGRRTGHAGHALAAVSGICHQLGIHGFQQYVEGLQGVPAGKMVEYGKSGRGTSAQQRTGTGHRDGYHRPVGSEHRIRAIQHIGYAERALSGIRPDRGTAYPHRTLAERNRHTRPPEGVRHRETYLRNALPQERRPLRQVHRDKRYLLPGSGSERGDGQHVGQRTVGNVGRHSVQYHAAEL